MWAPVLIIASAVLVVAALVAADRSLRTRSTPAGCASLLLSLGAFWATVSAGLALWLGV